MRPGRVLVGAGTLALALGIWAGAAAAAPASPSVPAVGVPVGTPLGMLAPLRAYATPPTSAAPTTAAPHSNTPAPGTTTGVSSNAALWLAVVLAVAGIGGAAWLVLRRRRAAAAYAHRGDLAGLAAVLREVGASGLSPAISQQIERLLSRPDTDRGALVQACMRLRDQLTGKDEAMRARLLVALAEAGVTEVTADGARFDPRLHEAVDNVAAPRTELTDTVASTVRSGYVDGDRVLRIPHVVVYR